MGFPGQSIHDIAMEDIEDEEDAGEEEEDDDEEEALNGEEAEDDEDGQEAEGKADGEAALDPRAGRVDVVMPVIVFDALEIVGELEQIKYKKFTRVKNRKTIDRVVDT